MKTAVVHTRAVYQQARRALGLSSDLVHFRLRPNSVKHRSEVLMRRQLH